MDKLFWQCGRWLDSLEPLWLLCLAFVLFGCAVILLVKADWLARQLVDALERRDARRQARLK